MKISGKVLDVNDGDAIVIHAKKEQQNLLVVIDGGDSAYGQKTLDEVKSYCTELDKDGPDLIVCTHFDKDHVAGLITLVDHYKGAIKEFWINQPQGALLEAVKSVAGAMSRIGDKNKILTISEEVIFNQFLNFDNYQQYQLLLEKVKLYEELLQKIKDYHIPSKEPFADNCTLEGWEEIVVLGPTNEYYDHIFPSGGSLAKLLTEEFADLLEADLLLESAKKEIVGNPCDMLKTRSDITATNKVSVIIRFDCEDGKYLFTGDAGIESFKKTIGYPGSITGMKFLKIPHHGSNNNLSKEIVDLIDPKIAYSTGARYEDPEVIACLQRKVGRIVKTTNTEGDLSF
jgi:beta-lactamase superfamily II metal-dependent hydrolase